MDSFFEPTECCKTFPSKHGFCWEYDANYCSTCYRWLESPLDSLPRPEKHQECPNSFCTPISTRCVCSHSDRKHHKSFLLNELMGLSEKEIEEVLVKFTSGPHACTECGCLGWIPDSSGPTD